MQLLLVFLFFAVAGKNQKWKFFGNLLLGIVLENKILEQLTWSWVNFFVWK